MTDQENLLQKKSKIPYFFFAFFFVIFAVNIFYIYLSKQSWRGVVTDDSYQKGIHYNETILQAKKQRDLEWSAKIKYQRLDEKTGLLQVKLFDKNSNRIAGANIYANLKRPTQEGFDFKVPLIFSNNFYEAKISFPLKGQWDVEIIATKGEDIFQEVKRYVIQ